MKVFFNQFNPELNISNGATRHNLRIVVAKDHALPINEGIGIVTPLRADLGTLTKGNTSFIFINPETAKTRERTVGVFINTDYGYTVKAGVELFTASSVGGYGNSESKYGIYEVGTVLEVHTYKDRQPSSYYQLTLTGWEGIDETAVEGFQQKEI